MLRLSVARWRGVSPIRIRRMGLPARALKLEGSLNMIIRCKTLTCVVAFAVTGGLNRELWYGVDSVLVKVAFAAKDDSRIEYVLR